MQSSVRDIRIRLLLLLLRAFVIVLLLSFFLFIITTGYILTTTSSPLDSQDADSLEGYYLGRGNWDGVGTFFASNEHLGSLNAILLDRDHRILLDRRPNSSSTIGSTYVVQRHDTVIDLSVQATPIGFLVVTPPIFQRFILARALLIPISVISFILALFLVVVSILLVRRFVNPLADVIYAARQVADGNFKTRISTGGPHDLQSLSESFNGMASSLERNDHERREMLADIAHELRTPLTVIRGRLEGIVDGIYSENGSQVSMALEQTYLLQRLVDDLRLLTLAETHQLPFDKRNIDIGDVIERVLEMFSAEAQEKMISLAFSERRGDLAAFIDPQRFEQVISNVIGNALRYIPEQGRIWVTATGSSEGVSVTVNDNGAGIPDEDLPFIFDRFWRKEKSRSRTSGGTGLGLAIARQLIAAQGGTINAANLPEGGLQIRIELSK